MFDAIILAGGNARRLDGTDKPALEIGGVALLDRAVAAAKGAEQIIVVGPERATATKVRWTREDPAGGGPVAAIAAGLEAVEEPWCLVLAADLPWIAPAVPLLLTSAAKSDVAVLTTMGRRNYLAAVWSTEALRAAIDQLDELRGAAVRHLFLDRQITDVSDDDDWGRDCDTWDDVEAAKARGGDHG